MFEENLEIKTKDKILKAAEELFSTNGLNATSIRSIVKKANVNLAAIHYHFGSKEKLLIEILKGHFTKLNQQRLNELNKLRKKAGNQTLKTSDILRALIKPVFEHLKNNHKKHFIRIVSRMYGEADDNLKNEMYSLFKEIIFEFSKELKKSNPNKTTGQINSKLFFTIGAMVHSVLNYKNLSQKSVESFPKMKDSEILEELIKYAAAGFES